MGKKKDENPLLILMKYSCFRWEYDVVKWRSYKIMFRNLKDGCKEYVHLVEDLKRKEGHQLEVRRVRRNKYKFERLIY